MKKKVFIILDSNRRIYGVFLSQSQAEYFKIQYEKLKNIQLINEDFFY